MKLLEIKEMSVHYNRLIAVDNVSLELEEGDYMSLIGPNGSGKSTLLKGVLGLVNPQSGKVIYHCSRSLVSYLPQVGSIPLDFPATVEEIINSGNQEGGKRMVFSTSQDKKRVDQVIEELSLKELRYARIGDLSGGQRQTVLLARSLCRKPKLLVLDEPYTGLDEQSRENLYSLLKFLNKEKALTILMASHDLEQVFADSNKVAIMSNKLRFIGSPEEAQNYRKKEGLKWI